MNRYMLYGNFVNIKERKCEGDTGIVNLFKFIYFLSIYLLDLSNSS